MLQRLGIETDEFSTVEGDDARAGDGVKPIARRNRVMRATVAPMLAALSLPRLRCSLCAALHWSLPYCRGRRARPRSSRSTASTATTPTRTKGGLDLTALKPDFADAENFARWVKVHDRIESGEMPPKKKPRPPADETAAAIEVAATNR